MAEPATVSVPPRARTSIIPTCVATRADGKPCQGACIRGTDHCRRHSAREKLGKAEAAAASITVSPLPVLVALDVTDDAQLRRFRRGIMAHVARGTLGVQEARALLDVALSIHESAHKDDHAQGFDSLATAIAEKLTPRGEGGIAQKGKE